jgi:tetratricopeptide (TPR) repeat protein
MLAGDKVFDGMSDPALQHVNDSPTPLRMIRPEVTPALVRLVLDLLAKSPEDRPADALNVFERLAPYLPTGLAAPSAAGGPVGVPDPTEPYRRPLAPRRSDIRPRAAMPRASTNGQTVVLPAPVAAALTAAEERADELIADGRYSQAVDLLEELLSSAPVADAADHARVLDARAFYAGALLVGKDYRRALSITNDLAAAYVRAGIRDERLVNCRTQAAYCQALLGDHEAALAEFRQLLAAESRTGGSQSDTALDLRRWICELLLITNRRRECIEWLEHLVAELRALRGPDDDSTREAESLLRRARSTPDR